MENIKEKMDHLIQLGIELNQIHDLDILLERILYQARRVVHADAGSIYIRENDILHFTYTQNETLQKQLPPGEKLIYSIFSIPINNESLAGYVAKSGRLLNIPDVYVLDSRVPYRFSKQFDTKTGYQSKAICTVPLKNARGDTLGILQVLNPTSGAKVFSSFDEDILLHFASIASVALERAQLMRNNYLRMISMAEMRDPNETALHINRVAGYAVELYEHYAVKHGITKYEIERNRDVLRIAAMLHDVGKIGISDLILNKPGYFSSDEFDIMKQHTVLGARLFQNFHSDYDEATFEVTLNHHERWDGKGYPGIVDIQTGKPLPGYELPNGMAKGKSHEEIPLFARVVSIADVFDALSTSRCYKTAWEEPQVLETIQKGAGTQFDPELIDCFFSCLNMIRCVKKRYANEGLTNESI